MAASAGCVAHVLRAASGSILALGAGWRWVFLAEAAFALIIAACVVILPLADVPGLESVRWRHMREAIAFAPGLLALVLVAMFLYIGAEHILNIWLAEFQVEAFGAGQGTAGRQSASAQGGVCS